MPCVVYGEGLPARPSAPVPATAAELTGTGPVPAHADNGSDRREGPLTGPNGDGAATTDGGASRHREMSGPEPLTIGTDGRAASLTAGRASRSTRAPGGASAPGRAPGARPY